jgi:hypothetical protein
MGTLSIEKRKAHGRPRVSFIKDDIPEDKESTKYQFMIDFINGFKVTAEEYQNHLETDSEPSIVSTNDSTSEHNDEQVTLVWELAQLFLVKVLFLDH